jgi:hypothetical protein
VSPPFAREDSERPRRTRAPVAARPVRRALLLAALLGPLGPAFPPARAEPFVPPSLPDAFSLTADRLTLDLEHDVVEADGVRLVQDGLDATAERAVLDAPARRLRLLGARLELALPDLPTLSAAAGEATIEPGGVTVREGSFSRCPLERAGWRVGFSQACLEPDGDLTVEDAVFRLFDVPLLWSPWLMLRLGRAPGLRPPEIGARQGRGPYVRLAAYLPTEALDDFQLSLTGFPMDDLDVAASWLGPFGRVDAGAARLIGGPRAFIHTDAVTRTGTLGGVVSRGLWAQAGFQPTGVVDALGVEESQWRFPSVRADRFALLGGDFWTVSAGATTWQGLEDGVLADGAASLPRLRLGWTPGALADVLRFPGAVRLSFWRPLDGLLTALDDRSHVLSAGWRQALELSVPGLPGTLLRPFAVAAGRREVDGTRVSDVLWAAGGLRASVTAERSWDAGRSLHRFGFELRYARVLYEGPDAAGPDVPLGPGPDLLRFGVPQTLRLGDVTLSGEAWVELRRLDAWDGDSAVFGTELIADGAWLDLQGRLALDGDGDLLVASARVDVPLGAPFELAVHYAYLDRGVASAALFLPWESRLELAPATARTVRHGLGGDAVLRILDGRISVSAGAEADLESPALAALRFGLTLADPGRCIALELGAQLWLDEPVPDVTVSLRL